MTPAQAAADQRPEEIFLVKKLPSVTRKSVHSRIFFYPFGGNELHGLFILPNLIILRNFFVKKKMIFIDILP
jgi:hypothetical protein